MLGTTLIFAGVTLRIVPSGLDGGGWLTGAIFTKVGIMLVVMWLAWPGIEAVRRTPGGATVLLCLAFGFVLFFYRPKTIFLTGPFLLVALAAAFLRSWISRRLK